MKRFISFLIVALMIVSMFGVSSLAASEDRQIRIDAEGFPYHQFAAYQLFSGTLSGSTLTDIQWGRNVNPSNTGSLITALQTASSTGKFQDTALKTALDALASDSTAAQVAAALGALVSTSPSYAEDAELLGHIIWDWNGWKEDGTGAGQATVLKSPAVTTDPTTPYYIKGDSESDFGDGYYFIKDITPNPNDIADTAPVRSSALLEIIWRTATLVDGKQQTLLTFKGSVPKLDKRIEDSGSYTDHDSASEAFAVQVGDTVNFKLESTFPSNYSDFTQYYVELEDTPTALSITTASVKVYVVNGGTETEVYVDGATCSVTGGGTSPLKVTIPNTKALKDNTSAHAAIATDKDSIIRVKYPAVVQSDALTTAAADFYNEVTLDYSRDPHSTTDHKVGPTEKEYLTTYSVTIVKDDAQEVTGKHLTLGGAVFSLYEVSSSGTAVALVSEGSGVYHIAKGSETGVTSFTTVVGEQIVIKGLDPDVATYYLEETTPPATYNTPSSRFAFTIKNKTVVDANIDTSNYYTTTSGVMEVQNNKGNVLPETGGIGTTIFITLGSVVAVFAGIFLVTNKRMSKEDI